MRTLKFSKVRAAAAVAVLALCLGAAHPASADEQALYQQTLQSTAFIVMPNSLGTGWVVDVEQRLVITNKHVVGNGNEAQVFFPEFRDGALVKDVDTYLSQSFALGIRGKVLYRDEKRDLALIQLDRLPKHVRALPLAAHSAGKGETVLAIGNSSVGAPAGQPRLLWKMRTGQVADKGFIKTMYQNTGDRLEVSMLISLDGSRPGDSGGPVVNARGELIAVTSGGSQGESKVSLAVDVSEVRVFLARALDQSPQRPPVGMVGTWTMAVRLQNGQIRYLGLTLNADGTCTVESQAEVPGTYRYDGGRLTLNLPGILEDGQLVAEQVDGDRFEVAGRKMTFSLVRR
jgi:S1-C subfamily serine protease